MSEILPKYISPCISESNSSLESDWLYPSDFGECYPPPSDHHIYPRVIPVYNGKVLDIETEFVHASLCGISIKHYYGKCTKEEEFEDNEDRDALYGDLRTEGNDYDWFGEEEEDDDDSVSFKNDKFDKKESDQSRSALNSTETTTGSFEYRDTILLEGQPLCTLPKINYRNSFWNIHRPELCKLTWGQQYVGESLVTEHLHEHLMQHGALCASFHTEEDMFFMLTRELDEYVRLKVLQEPRKLPPDEQLFDFRPQPQISKLLNTPKCKMSATTLKTAINDNERYLALSDDEDEMAVTRSKEEFCLTIGKHIRRAPIVEPEVLLPEDFITPGISVHGEEEEGSALFYYNWHLYAEEEPYEDEPDKIESLSVTISEPEPLVQPCPPLMMDEFCRAAGKVDFSDLRCDPDF